MPAPERSKHTTAYQIAKMRIRSANNTADFLKNMGKTARPKRKREFDILTRAYTSCARTLTRARIKIQKEGE